MGVFGARIISSEVQSKDQSWCQIKGYHSLSLSISTETMPYNKAIGNTCASRVAWQQGWKKISQMTRGKTQEIYDKATETNLSNGTSWSKRILELWCDIHAWFTITLIRILTDARMVSTPVQSRVLPKIPNLQLPTQQDDANVKPQSIAWYFLNNLPAVKRNTKSYKVERMFWGYSK